MSSCSLSDPCIFLVMLLNYRSFFLPCVWLFLLLHPKVFGKFWVFQCFWRWCHLFASCSLQNWMLFSQGVLLLTFRASHWALLAAVTSESYQKGGLRVWCCELLRFGQPCKWSPWLCWHVNCAVLYKSEADSIIFVCWICRRKTYSVCFDYFLTVARICSLATYTGTVIVFGAVIGRKVLVSGKFSRGILANLEKSSLTVFPVIFLALSPLVCYSFSLHSRIGRKRQSDCTSVLGKVCLWQSKQRCQALLEVLEFVSVLEKKKRHVFCCRIYISNLNWKRITIIKSRTVLFFQSTPIICKSALGT